MHRHQSLQKCMKVLRGCQLSVSPTASVWRPGEAVNILRHLQPVYKGPEKLSASPTSSVWRPGEAVNFLHHLQTLYEGPERLSTFYVTCSQCMKAHRGCQLSASPTASLWRSERLWTFSSPTASVWWPGEAVHDECWWMRMSVQMCVVIKCIYSRC